MSAAAPNPSNLILLAVLGVGAYLYATRRAQAAAPMMPTWPTAPASRASEASSILGSVGNLLGRLTGSNSSAPAGQTPAPPGIGSRGTMETMTRPYVPWEDGWPVNPAPGIEFPVDTAPSIEFPIWNGDPF